jgi:hypothetical protein
MTCCAFQFGRASAPIVPHFVQTMRGPNHGTTTSSATEQRRGQPCDCIACTRRTANAPQARACCRASSAERERWIAAGPCSHRAQEVVLDPGAAVIVRWSSTLFPMASTAKGERQITGIGVPCSQPIPVTLRTQSDVIIQRGEGCCGCVVRSLFGVVGARRRGRGSRPPQQPSLFSPTLTRRRFSLPAGPGQGKAPAGEPGL